VLGYVGASGDSRRAKRTQHRTALLLQCVCVRASCVCVQGSYRGGRTDDTHSLTQEDAPERSTQRQGGVRRLSGTAITRAEHSGEAWQGAMRGARAPAHTKGAPQGPGLGGPVRVGRSWSGAVGCECGRLLGSGLTRVGCEKISTG
jgi:hypothetical protein